ncbi:MAG: peptidase S11 [Betaproteobacteria bacterium]|nr:peptidase S11 [Betaproteobacteria bacterium]
MNLLQVFDLVKLFFFVRLWFSRSMGCVLKQIASVWVSLCLSMGLMAWAKAAESVKSSQSTTKKAAVQAQRHKAKTPVKARVDTRPSFGKVAGLHEVSDELSLKSSVALVVDQETQEVLLSKNDSAVLPIASITKLMTGLLINEAQLPLDEIITITQDDVDTEKGSRSRLQVGTSLARGELLHLALMASENRAAHALGRTFPGGFQHFVGLMNQKAKDIGMTDTRFVEPTGLSSQNQSSAKDLVTLVQTAYREPLLRDLSTSDSHVVDVGRHSLKYKTTNRLINNPSWDIGLQKTGYISEAGQCLVMQAKIAGRKLIMVFLDSAGKFSRIADAERVRRWVEAKHRVSVPQT